ncbi:PREDICTED: allantoicase-like [Priapulus caudatus]|uniref:Allantoate amidinohydrolase n=1 Tax=Priapulus caudatus TaxID=37621 RepID=A0ABM1EIB7_PRICU|nr:PREDICTED: allantoicase-like [Priapulus caudatus]
MADRPLTSDRGPKFTELNDLVSQKAGGKILFATDDWFAVAENLLKVEPAAFDKDAFTSYGKLMDGWETRRKRKEGHDWCVVRLAMPGVIHGVEVDTSFFTGNHAPRVSLQAARLTSQDEAIIPRRVSKMGSEASAANMKKVAALKSEEWQTILPMTATGPGYSNTCRNYYRVQSRDRWTHLRFNIYPDGGVARLRVYGQVIPDWSKLPANMLMDLVAMESGGVCVGYSNVHYGHARNLIGKGRSSVMSDGWETARKIDRPAILESDLRGVLKVPGNEWATFRLGHPGTILKVVIDTNLFKGNFPDSCKVEACNIGMDEESEAMEKFGPPQWKLLLPTVKLSADRLHHFDAPDVKMCGVVSHVRLTMAPDGGISRMRLFGLRRNKANL